MVSLACKGLLGDKKHGITVSAYDLKNASNTQLHFDSPTMVNLGVVRMYNPSAEVQLVETPSAQD